MIEVTSELLEAMPLGPGHLMVLGVSTSEVAGERIGTAGSNDVASSIMDGALELQQKYGYHLAFQCCEHLNRALVVTRPTQASFGLSEVAAVPVPSAGGAMAAYAFRHLEQAVLVEAVRADAGIDIGDTLIGMHLKPVAVPVRPPIDRVGAAHVTMARTRPKLIGGARAVYVLDPE
ncbi:MAG: TIGR01440 family protein [Firmicutes bacterium]|nr:TIGR01440 family protein [Melghirimyces thermohalophilus]MDA8353756.1 TIGR01440 family protein [Bacillota bacterium]